MNILLLRINIKMDQTCYDEVKAGWVTQYLDDQGHVYPSTINSNIDGGIFNVFEEYTITTDSNSTETYDNNCWSNTHTLNGHTDQVVDVDFNHDGIQIVSGDNANIIRVQDYKVGDDSWTHTHTLKGHIQDIAEVSFNQDGTQIVSSSCDSTIRIWQYNKISQTCEYVLAGHTGSWVNDVTFSPDDNMIFPCGEDSTFRVWEWEWSQDSDQYFSTIDW